MFSNLFYYCDSLYGTTIVMHQFIYFDDIGNNFMHIVDCFGWGEMYMDVLYVSLYGFWKG